MSRKIALPDGGWALLRDPKQVPERLRRPVLRALPQLSSVDVENGTANISVETIDGIFDLKDAAIVALVEQWSFDVPVTVESVMDLPGSVVDELEREVTPLVFEMVNGKPPEDPESPTHASRSSVTG